ncbi:MAG: hypothetical protein KF767_17990 [Bdellovibrionaceae bacterium]|nr:hypothetical protein [Pseudobdellovibrionaceae bacterium]
MRQILFSTGLLGPLVFLAACASSAPAPETPPPTAPAAIVDPSGSQTTLPLPKEGENPAGPEITMKRDDKTGVTAGLAEKIGPPPVQDITHAKVAPEKQTGPTPEVSMRYLRNGNTRYLKRLLRKDGQGPKDIQRLKTGQKPHAIVISCSDSRVPPEIVFDQKLGELFVIRTAGQTLSPEVVASVEYAVEHLGPRLILVLGHTSCGAVHATSDAILGHSHAYTKDPLEDSPNIAALIKDLRPRIEQSVRSQPTPRLVNEGWANVRGAAKELFDLSPYLTARLNEGHLKVVGGLYDLESGAVDFK